MKVENMDCPPPGSIAARHNAGWAWNESFKLRFRHFVHFLKPSKGDRVILTLDGRYSHWRNISAIDCAR